MGIRACIWPTGTPNPPAIAWSPPGPCLQRGHHALHQAGDIQRGLGSSRMLHRLRLPPCPAATGQIICLSQNNIPVVVRERVGAGWAGTSIPVVVGSRTEDLFIFEQGRGKVGTLSRYHACFVAHTITEDGTAPPPSPGELTRGLWAPLNHSACPGDLRLRKKQRGQILALNMVLGDLSSQFVVWTLTLCTGGEKMESHVLQVSRGTLSRGCHQTRPHLFGSLHLRPVRTHHHLRSTMSTLGHNPSF